MKTLNITFTDEEYKRLFKAKREMAEKFNTNLSWHKFVLRLVNGVSVKRN